MHIIRSETLERRLASAKSLAKSLAETLAETLGETFGETLRESFKILQMVTEHSFFYIIFLYKISFKFFYLTSEKVTFIFASQ